MATAYAAYRPLNQTGLASCLAKCEPTAKGKGWSLRLRAKGKGWSLRLQGSAARRRSSVSSPSFDQREREIIGHDGNGRGDHKRSEQQRPAYREERRPVKPDRRVLMRHVQPWWQRMGMA